MSDIQRAGQRAGVIGAGAWGTALAQVCAAAGLEVMLQAREPEVVESITARRINDAFLPDVPLSDRIRPTGDLAYLSGCDLILAGPPAQHLRATLTAFAPFARPGAPVVLCSKGIERGSLKLMTEVLAETLPDAPAAVLSGPSFAGEVARGLPGAVTLACAGEALGQTLMETLSSPAFRCYLVDDLIGAEAGGAVKNVLAIACGIVEGRKLGRSAHAAVITRGFAEMTRMGVALGGQAETVAAVIAHYAAAHAQVVVTDAGRGYAAKLEKALASLGFARDVLPTPEAPCGVATLRFERLAVAA